MFSYFSGFFNSTSTQTPVVSPVNPDKDPFKPDDPAHIALIRKEMKKFAKVSEELAMKDKKFVGILGGITLLNYIGLFGTYLTAAGYATAFYYYLNNTILQRSESAVAFNKQLRLLETLYTWAAHPVEGQPEPAIAGEIRTMLKPYMQPKLQEGKWTYLFNSTNHHLKEAGHAVVSHAAAIKENVTMVLYGHEPSDNRLRPVPR